MNSPQKNVLQIAPTDNVLVALQNLEAGTTVTFNYTDYSLKNNIPSKHKFFMENMPVGSAVYMYGVLVGKTTKPVQAGELMTVHNTAHAAEPYSYKNVPYNWQPPDVSEYESQTFLGYKRSNGLVGTANYWLFIPTVFCENRNLAIIKEALYKQLGYSVDEPYQKYTKNLIQAFVQNHSFDDVNFDAQSIDTNSRIFKNVDGIKFLNHNGGCGGTRQDAETLSKLLASYATHPNVAGVTIVSLGCEHLQTTSLLEEIKKSDPNFDKPLYVFEQQKSASEQALIAEAIKQTMKGLVLINNIERTPQPLSYLSIGVKCGGSDGFSGISANPAVGYCADMIVALGGKVLLAEFPELCGVEQNMIDRAVDELTAEKFIKLMTEYDKLAHAVGSGFYMNPSPGNIKDGLITDAIKSAGAAQKAGSAPVTDVLDYTEKATKPGLSLVCTPGNDVEATTGQASAGANLILFTTGLGTPTGNPICPVIKIATNTTLAAKMPDIIDIDTGSVIEGEKTIQQMGKEILDYCIAAASGAIIPKAVQLNQDDFIPWKRGVSL